LAPVVLFLLKSSKRYFFHRPVLDGRRREPVGLLAQAVHAEGHPAASVHPGWFKAYLHELGFYM
jgi:hypothetical protein